MLANIPCMGPMGFTKKVSRRDVNVNMRSPAVFFCGAEITDHFFLQIRSEIHQIAIFRTAKINK